MTDPCFYMIACDETSDRRDFTLAHLKENGVSPLIWKGIYGSTWGLHTRIEYKPGEVIWPRQLALIIGYRFLFQHLSLTIGPNDIVVIFEDDVKVENGFLLRLKRLLSQLSRVRPSWGWVFLGMGERESHAKAKMTPGSMIPTIDATLFKLSDPFGMHALMLRASSLPVILKHLDPCWQLDLDLYERVLKPGLLDWWAVTPYLATQRTGRYDDTNVPEWPSTLRP